MIVKSLLVCLLVLGLSGCVTKYQTVYVRTPKPTVPVIGQLNLKTVEWKAITSADQIVIEPGTTWYVLDGNQMKRLNSNLNQIQKKLKEQQLVIQVYEKSFDK